MSQLVHRPLVAPRTMSPIPKSTHQMETPRFVSVSNLMVRGFLRLLRGPWDGLRRGAAGQGFLG